MGDLHLERQNAIVLIAHLAHDFVYVIKTSPAVWQKRSTKRLHLKILKDHVLFDQVSLKLASKQITRAFPFMPFPKVLCFDCENR